MLRLEDKGGEQKIGQCCLLSGLPQESRETKDKRLQRSLIGARAKKQGGLDTRSRGKEEDGSGQGCVTPRITLLVKA